METRELSQLKANPNNPRGEVVVDESLYELAASIKAEGVLQPILITPDGTIVCGHRRVKACAIAEVRSIPVVVREMTEDRQIQIMLIENLQRQDLNPVQEGKAFLQLISRGLTANQIHLATGIGNDKISIRIAIASLPEECHPAFAARKLPPSCARCLDDLESREQIEWVAAAVANDWPGTKLCSEIYDSKYPPPPPERPTFEKSILDRVYERIDNGCYTPEAVNKCDECGSQIFKTMSQEYIKAYMEELVRIGKVRKTKQGGKKDDQRGSMNDLYMPVEDISEPSFRDSVSAFQRQPKPDIRRQHGNN